MKEKKNPTSPQDPRAPSQNSVDAMYPRKAPVSSLNRMKLKYLTQRPRHEYAICNSELNRADVKQDSSPKKKSGSGPLNDPVGNLAAKSPGTTLPSKSVKHAKSPAPSIDRPKAITVHPIKKKGNKADKPLINGVPFWFVGRELEEEDDTEVENTIDTEFIKSVLDNNVTLRPNPIPENMDLDPLGSITVIKNYCGYYNEDNVIHATVLNAVLDASSQSLTTRLQRPPLQVMWDKKVKVVELNLETRGVVNRGVKQLIEPKPFVRPMEKSEKPVKNDRRN